MTTTSLTRYDRGMLRLMNDRRARPLYATAVRRRLVVCAHVVLTTAIGGLLAHLSLAGTPPVWAVVTVAVLLLPWMVATGAINAATRGLLELRGRALDERQTAERARVRARAHQVVSLLLAVAAVALLAGGAVDGRALSVYAAPLVIGVLAVHWLTPLWVAGLMARDEPAEDDGPVV